MNYFALYLFDHYLSGGYRNQREDDEIFELDLTSEEWRIVDKLYEERQAHAASSIDQDLWKYCI